MARTYTNGGAMTRRGRVLEKSYTFQDGIIRKAAKEHYCSEYHGRMDTVYGTDVAKATESARLIAKGEAYVHCPRSSNNWNGQVNYHMDCAIKKGIIIDRPGAELAERALAGYAERTGLKDAALADRITNLLADLRHLTAANVALDFDYMLAESKTMFDREAKS